MEGWIHILGFTMDGWVGGRVDGWMGGVGGWVDGWVGRWSSTRSLTFLCKLTEYSNTGRRFLGDRTRKEEIKQLTERYE